MKRSLLDTNRIITKDKISRHTLESDDEGDNSILNQEELIGQEENTVDYDGEIKITPFNMKEELEDDGHFDASGTFIFRKNNESGDNWLADIDWAEVKRQEENNKKQTVLNLSTENDELPPITADDRLKLYQEICGFMNPRESVLRALKRLGPVKVSGQQRRNWIRRKDGTTSEKDNMDAGGDFTSFARLTELANDLLGAGDYDIYQKTKEVIADFVKTSKKAVEEDDLDAIAADLDFKTGLKVTDLDESGSMGNAAKWLIKKGGANADTEIEGPFTKEDVQRWLYQKRFTDPDKVFIKRQGTDDAFLPLSEVNISPSV